MKIKFLKKVRSRFSIIYKPIEYNFRIIIIDNKDQEVHSFYDSKEAAIFIIKKITHPIVSKSYISRKLEREKRCNYYKAIKLYNIAG